MVDRVSVGPDPIDQAALVAAVADPAAGATCLFLGTVRDHHEGRAVERLAYEAYNEMAAAAISGFIEEAMARWPGIRAVVAHRTGVLEIGEVSVAVAVSAAHRAEAFDACRHVMERIKEDAPIWKKEHYRDGDGRWVGVEATPRPR